ncbi:MAG: hypothetical protein JNK41_11390 [Saprospiraceae bacterium]|jgi:hypothetical protein|nr:hypothetical protein [Saprospiraceae bacterium]
MTFLYKTGLNIKTMALFGVIWFVSGCYSFKGISIPDNVSTFFVVNTETRASALPASFPLSFSENLKNKIRNESRLKYTETDPDLEFIPIVQEFRVVPIAPKPGETAAINRLELTIEIECINHKNEKENWKQNFKHFADFSSSENLLTVQDQLLKVISEQLLEDIFNRSFTNW